jgi:catechol 2,3-dioxygenase-like lactoylglutathione lyase family enzyme
METVELARHWLKQESTDASRRQAAVRVLSMTHADDAAKQLGKLLKEPELRRAMLRVAYELPDPRFVPALIQAFEQAGPETLLFMSAIGRAGGSEAVEFLGQQLARHANAAAYALALSPGEQAEAVLVQALSNQKTRRSATRALVVRAKALGSEAGALHQTLEHLLKAKSPSDRAAAAFGLSALYASENTQLIASKDRAVVLAAARNAQHGPMALAAARRLATETDPELCLALSNALSDEVARDLVPNAKLLRIIESGSAAASLAVRTLGARLAGPTQALVSQLSEHPSPQFRAEFALGLGDATAPAAMGLLFRGYEFETDAVVRRSIVAAVSARSESNRERLMDLARRLDPDQAVRQLAQLARAGHNLVASPSGNQSFWLNLDWRGKRPSTIKRTPVLLQGSRGHTLVAFADPDGFVGVVGLDAGPLSYFLAEPAD